ncbi:MAG: 50S ribosomal protein L22 [Candidatus Moranbacteria bacterium RBG_13_45_13]|nr:MAG: 50S ribosomal protein L22 [Candidatus Moranbacteria bacterium RBG_13_45_13]
MKATAKLNNLRKSPRKVRLVAEFLKGSDVSQAENQLKFLVKGSVPHFEKLLKSAVANAENNFGLDRDNLYIKDIVVDESSKLKRWLPRAHGRASLLLKRTCNVEIILDEKVKGKGRKKVAKQEIKDVKKTEIEEKIGEEEQKETKKEIIKEKEEKEFIDEKKKMAESKSFLKRVFRRKSM